jgi:hypothetical protein
MRWLAPLCLISLPACGADPEGGIEFGGATGAEPISSLSAAISWQTTDDDSTRYAIFASEAPGGQDFANPDTVTEAGAIRGPLSGLQPGVDTYVVVRAMDQDGNTDDNTVEIVARAGDPVSLAADLQSIYDRRCAYAGCHAAELPAEALDLSPGAAYAATVGVEAIQCSPSRLLVAAGAPGDSYMIDKINGQDMCAGVPMPRTGNVNSVDVQILGDWIAEGALDN